MSHPLTPYLIRARGSSGLTPQTHRRIESELNRIPELEAEIASLKGQLASALDRAPKARKENA